MAPKGCGIDQSIMASAIERNSHGWGFTSINRDTQVIHTEIGQGLASAWKVWKQFAGTERIFHARVSTSGKVSKENQHPFDVTPDSGKERWFFHNGVIRDIPSLDPDLSDTHHFSLLLASFETNKNLVNMLQASAHKNNSRYILAELEQTWYFGRGWLTREGVMYSNASALSGKKIGGSNAPKEGGEFDNKQVEVTCETQVDGWGYDAKRKLYSSLLEAPKFYYGYYDDRGAYNYGTGRHAYQGREGLWADDEAEFFAAQDIQGFRRKRAEKRRVNSQFAAIPERDVMAWSEILVCYVTHPATLPSHVKYISTEAGMYVSSSLFLGDVGRHVPTFGVTTGTLLKDIPKVFLEVAILYTGLGRQPNYPRGKQVTARFNELVKSGRVIDSITMAELLAPDKKAAQNKANTNTAIVAHGNPPPVEKRPPTQQELEAAQAELDAEDEALHNANNGVLPKSQVDIVIKPPVSV